MAKLLWNAAIFLGMFGLTVAYACGMSFSKADVIVAYAMITMFQLNRLLDIVLEQMRGSANEG